MQYLKAFAVPFLMMLFVSGCSSITYNIASPDVEGGRYQVTEGGKTKVSMPSPGTMGILEEGRYQNVYEIVDFKASQAPNGNIPDNHMIAVAAFDPDVKDGRLIIPIQHITKIESKDFKAFVYHNIEGIKSPIRIDTMKGDYDTHNVLREYTKEGKFVDFVFKVLVNTEVNEVVTKDQAWKLSDIYISVFDEYQSHRFYAGPDYQALKAERVRELEGKRAEREIEYHERQRENERQEAQKEQLLAASKSVGQMVCSLDRWLGVVEQVEGNRVKVNIIGKALGVTTNSLLFSNSTVPFSIDSDDEGLLRWFDSDKLARCNIDVTHF